MAQNNMISKQDISEDKEKIIKMSSLKGTVILIQGESTDNRLLMLTQSSLNKIKDCDIFNITEPHGSGISEIVGKYITSKKPLNPWKGWHPIKSSDDDDWEIANWDAIYYLS